MGFKLEDYTPVDERLKMARKDYPTMVVHSIMLNELPQEAGAPVRWVFQTNIYRTPEDKAAGLLWSTGYASEIDGMGHVNKTSACENAETSAIGRALANAGYSGNNRASRDEMDKVRRYEEAERKLIVAIENAPNREELTKLWNYACGNGLSRSEMVSAAFKTRGEAIGDE